MQRKPLSIDGALTATWQTSRVAFEPNPANGQDWQNLIRDVVAVANTAGGIILIGVDKRGNPQDTKQDTQDITPQEITTRIATYTGTQLEDFRIQHATKQARQT